MKILSGLKRMAMLAVLICMVGMTLTACGDSPTATVAPAPTNTTAVATATTATTATTGTTDSNVQEVALTIKEWEITPKVVELKAGKVRFTITNAGTMSHNITILQDGDVVGSTPTFAGTEGTKTIEVDMQAGTYDMLCSLPGHAARGQTGTITVK